MGERATLVKFGQHAHLAQLQEEGLLYMNNLPYFWGVEDEDLRGDPFDSVAEVERGHRGQLTLSDGTEWPAEITEWALRQHPLEPEKTNIFCMYALRPSAGTYPVDTRNLQFGDYALVMTNPQQFIDRTASCLKSQGLKGKAGLVEYVDNKYAGRVGPFRKLQKFAYQSEWRLVCFDGPGDVRKISIGGIQDISTIMLSSELNEKIQDTLGVSFP
jgi:hypothetical protein